MLSDTFVLFNSTVVTGTSTAYPMNGFDRLSMNVQWVTGTLAGQIVFECASTSDYSGTWQNIATFNYSDGTPPFEECITVDYSGMTFVRARFAVDATAAKYPYVAMTRSKVGN